MLSDQASIVGVDWKSHKVIARETLAVPCSLQSSKCVFGSLKTIYTVLVCEKLNAYFAGSFGGQLVQYELATDKLVRNFGNLGIHHLTSSACFGNMAVFGGWDFRLQVVLVQEAQLFLGFVRTAVRHIDSLKLCPVFDGEGQCVKMLLAVTGRKPDYLGDSVDVFEVTALLRRIKICLPRKVLTQSNYIDCIFAEHRLNSHTTDLSRDREKQLACKFSPSADKVNKQIFLLTACIRNKVKKLTEKS